MADGIVTILAGDFKVSKSTGSVVKNAEYRKKSKTIVCLTIWLTKDLNVKLLVCFNS